MDSMESLPASDKPKLKNERLYSARMQLGLEQSEVAEAVGVSGSYICMLECMYVYPTGDTARKICDFYRSYGIEMSEEEVFPEWLKEYVQTKSLKSGVVPIERIVGSGHAQEYASRLILPSPVDALISEELASCSEDITAMLPELLGTLKPRHRFVLAKRYGYNISPATLKEIGKSIGVSSRERPRQIEKCALEQLKKNIPEKLIELMDC